MMMTMINQSHNQVRYNHNRNCNHMFNHNNYDSDNFPMNQSQVTVSNGGYGGGCGGYATWQPVVNNNSGFRTNNWKMNKRNINRINNSNNINNNVNNKSNLKEMQQQNRLKPRRFTKKKYTKCKSSAPLAPRNTTSFLIRAKKSGGLACLVSPCAVTPAVLPTPVFSPSSEVLGDMVKEEWGVDGYGSMKGLIRLKSSGSDDDEESVIDHDLSRFEMVYPSKGGERSSSLESRVDEQVSHIARLEEENLVLKERLVFMEREFGELKTRLESLEVKKQNDSENDNSDGNQCSVCLEGNTMDNTGVNECFVHNDDHKMEDEDNATKDRKLNGMVVNIDSGNNMDNNDENECSVHNESHKMEDEDNAAVGAKDRKLHGMVVNVDSSDISIELTETVDDMVGDGVCVSRN